jgi:hypothetical protein
LLTPFFDGQSTISCANKIKFQSQKPEEATQEIIDITKIPNWNLQNDYIKIKVQ